MNIVARTTFAVLCLAASPLPCFAQNTLFGAAHQPPQFTADPAALALARTLVAKTVPDDIAALNFLYPPLTHMLVNISAVDSDQLLILVHEAGLPVLQKHRAEIDAIQAETYAAALSPEDMKAAIAFYSTPAGADYAHSWAPLLKLDRDGVDKMLVKLKPEIDTEAKAVMKTHGWAK